MAVSKSCSEIDLGLVDDLGTCRNKDRTIGKLFGASACSIGNTCLFIGGIRNVAAAQALEPFLQCSGFDVSNTAAPNHEVLDVGNEGVINRAGHASWVIDGAAYLYGGQSETDQEIMGDLIRGTILKGQIVF